MTQSEKTVNAICGRLSLRAPQRESLERLARITELYQSSGYKQYFAPAPDQGELFDGDDE